MSPASHKVHLVDATSGPLVGEGHVQRVVPFAITGLSATAVSFWGVRFSRPGLAAAGTVLIAATIVTALSVPWHRLARATQGVVPLSFLVGTLLLADSTGRLIGSPFVTMAVLPLLWLSIYETRALVVAAAILAGVMLWLFAPHGGGSVAAPAGASAAVIAICGVGMGITIHDLVTDARRLAGELRDNQLALEHAAAMLNALPERVVRYRFDDHVITYCNPVWSQQYGLEPGQIIGKPLDDFLPPDGLAGLKAQLAMLGPERPVLVDRVARSAPNDPGRWVEWVDQYVVRESCPEVLAVGRDVTDRHETERLLAESEARFRSLSDKSVDVVWRFILEPAPHFDYMSPSVERILGYPASYFLEDFGHMLAILDAPGVTAIERALRGEPVLGRFDFQFRHANGSTVIGETRTTPIRGGLQGVSRDVTELRQLQSKLAELALRDALTGLANRRLLDELLHASLARTQRNNEPLAVAYLDLDGFKRVNDTYGHDAGDFVLCECARRLQTVVRGADTVARVGGDEFVVMYEPMNANSDCLVERIEHALSAPINITPTIAVCCPASIGVADTRSVGYSAARLVATADKAMYEAKRSRRLKTLRDHQAGAA